jgi:hypothetical protein
MQSGDQETQAIVREELRLYGESMEKKVAEDRKEIQAKFDHDRDELAKKIEAIEKNTNRTAIDIAVIKSRLDER